MPTAPVTSINTGGLKTIIRTANGQAIASAATATLNNLALPPAARTGHIMPTFTNNLPAWGNSAMQVATRTSTNMRSMFTTALTTSSSAVIENKREHGSGVSTSPKPQTYNHTHWPSHHRRPLPREPLTHRQAYKTRAQHSLRTTTRKHGNSQKPHHSGTRRHKHNPQHPRRRARYQWHPSPHHLQLWGQPQLTP